MIVVASFNALIFLANPALSPHFFSCKVAGASGDGGGRRHCKKDRRSLDQNRRRRQVPQATGIVHACRIYHTCATIVFVYNSSALHLYYRTTSKEVTCFFFLCPTSDVLLISNFSVSLSAFPLFYRRKRPPSRWSEPTARVEPEAK